MSDIGPRIGPVGNKSGTTSSSGRNAARIFGMTDRRLHKLENRRPKKIEVPWFIGQGNDWSANGDLIVTNWRDGSYASSNIDGFIYPDIEGIWQVTFSWVNVTDHDVEPIIVGRDEYSVMRRDMPTSYSYSASNQMTAAVYGGPDDNMEVRCAVSNDANLGDARGRVVGQLVQYFPPTLET